MMLKIVIESHVMEAAADAAHLPHLDKHGVPFSECKDPVCVSLRDALLDAAAKEAEVAEAKVEE